MPFSGLRFYSAAWKLTGRADPPFDNLPYGSRADLSDENRAQSNWIERLKRRRWLWILFFLTIAVFGAELFARHGLGLGTPPLTIAHPTIEYMYLSDQDVSRFGNRFLVNSYGMRADDFPREKAPNELRILVFGDSVVNGGSLTDHSQLATTLLQERLRSTTGRSVFVGNVSAGSWGPGNWLAYAKEFGFFDADIVGLVISSHDYADYRTFKNLDKNIYPWETPPSALMEGIQRYLPRYIPNFSNPERKKNPKGPDSQKIATVLEELFQFLFMAKQEAAVVVFQHWERKELNNGTLDDGGVRIAKICEQLGVPVVSLRTHFVHSIRNGQNPYRDNIHINAIGQELISRSFFEAFATRALH